MEDLDFARADFTKRASEAPPPGALAQPPSPEAIPPQGDAPDQAATQPETAPLPHGSWPAAIAWGSAGAAAGALLHRAVAAILGYELGLVALAIGILVGKGVRRGAGALHSRGLVALAVALTYLAIVAGYVPGIYESLDGAPGSLARFEQAAALALLAPVLLAVEGEWMSLVIVGIGLWEAYRCSSPPRPRRESPASSR